MKQLDWHNCYDDGWRDVITPESFAHPAKMARGLLSRIVAHGFARGWWAAGDRIGDCFGGVGTTGIIGAYEGLRVVSVELEPRFVGLSHDNWNMHLPAWEKLGCLLPCFMQGDSRRFDEIVGGVAGVIGSPPYADTAVAKNSAGIDRRKQWETYRASGGGMGYEAFAAQQERHSGDYGSTSGQIGRLPPGNLAAVLTSQPYAEGLGHDIAPRLDDDEDRRRETEGCGRRTYGSTPGQIGALRAGCVDGVVTSPPFMAQMNQGGAGSTKIYQKWCEQNGRDPNAANARTMGQSRQWGEDPDQMGNMSGETYWQAMRDVYAAMGLALRPGGVACIVVKDYVKAGQIVPLCDQTLELLLSLGFEPVERIRAWLVKETRTAGLWGETVKRTERKSFFRRLHEKKRPETRIDFEQVIVVRKRRANAGEPCPELVSRLAAQPGARARLARAKASAAEKRPNVRPASSGRENEGVASC